MTSGKSFLFSKLMVDGVMTVLFAFLAFGYSVSALWHELLGIGLAVLFLLHIGLNVPRCLQMLRQLGQTRKGGLPLVGLILDGILIVGMIVLTVTGILLSVQLFPDLYTGDRALAVSFHTVTTQICLGVMGVHIGLHGAYLMGLFRQMETKEGKQSIKRVLSGCAACIAAVAMVYTLIATAVSNTIPGLMPQAVTDTSAGHKTQQTQETQNKQAGNPAATQVLETTPTSQSSADTDKPQASVTQSTQAPATSQVTTSQVTTSQVTTPTTAAAAAPTLQEYLGGLNCNGCHRRCSLLSPQCGRGQSQAQQATAEYESAYGSNG